MIVPSLTAPAQDAGAVSRNPELTWQRVEGLHAVSYEVVVFLGDANSGTPDSVHAAVIPQTASGQSITHTLDDPSRIAATMLLPGTLYSWQVCVRDDEAACIARSAIRRFTTADGPPLPPTLAAPANGNGYWRSRQGQVGRQIVDLFVDFNGPASAGAEAARLATGQGSWLALGLAAFGLRDCLKTAGSA